jgi:hypothetical protein
MSPEIEQAAIAAVREMVANGHAAKYIAGQFNRDGIPTVTGRGAWSHTTVTRFCAKHGIDKPQHDPVRIAEVAAEQANKPKPPLSTTLDQMIKEEFTALQITDAKAYMGGLSDEDNEYLSKQKCSMFFSKMEFEIEAVGDDSEDGAFARANADAIDGLLDILDDETNYVARADWARWELFMRDNTTTSEERMERRLKWLTTWMYIEQQIAKAEKKNTSRLRRAERDPSGARVTVLESAIKRAQVAREKSLAKIAELERMAANPTLINEANQAECTEKGLFAKPTLTLTGIKSELERAQFMWAKADRELAAKVTELEALQASI